MMISKDTGGAKVTMGGPQHKPKVKLLSILPFGLQIQFTLKHFSSSGDPIIWGF